MITARQLENGIRIVMEEMPQVQSIAIGVWVRTGAVDEAAKSAGISHFVEHMMFKGTRERSARDIAADIDRIGGQINAFTSKETTCYYVKSLASDYAKAADVIVDMLENSLFEKKEMDRERMVICEEIKMNKDQPDDLAHEKFVEGMFRGEPLGNSVIGTRKTLTGITHNVIRKYVDEQYSRDSIVVSVAGNFEPEEICGYFQDKFLSLRESKPERVSRTSDYQPEVHVIKKDIQQSHLCMGTRAISMDDDRNYAFRILNNILGGGMSSRLFQNIREEKGLAYTVYSMLGSFSSNGYFEIYAGVSHNRIREAIAGIREEIQVLAEAPVTEDEMESSRAQIKSAYVFSQESPSSRMMANGRNYLLLGKTYTPEEVIAAYDSVGIEDIEKVKSIITDFDQYSAVLTTNKRVDLRAMMRRS